MFCGFLDYNFVTKQNRNLKNSKLRDMAIKALKKSRSVDRDLVQAILYRQIAQNAAMDDAETGPSQTTLLSAGPQNESNLEEKQAALFSSDVLFS